MDCLDNAIKKAFKKPTNLPPLDLPGFDINDLVKRFFNHDNEESLTDVTKKKRDNESSELLQWLKVLQHPSVILILGGRGQGKSALGFKIPEYLKNQASVFVVGLPKRAIGFLPDWIGCVPTIGDLPPDSIAIIDESYNLFHSRMSASEKSMILSNIINLSRQRNQTLIFVTQEARQVDKNISSSANVIIFKNPGIMQYEFERRELKKLAEEAKRMFSPIANKDKPRWSYVYAPESNFTGMLENSLPNFWTPGLSKAYADTKNTEETIVPKKMTREEKISKAKELHGLGWSYAQIAKYFGVSKSTVYNWIHGYPFKKNGKGYQGF